jgi:taurine dioxygenase
MENTNAPTITPLAPAVGAEVFGVDLARPLDDRAFAAIHRAFLDHAVLVFRDQDIGVTQHLAFTRRFGEPEVHILDQFNLPGFPHILVLSNAKDETGAPLGLEDAGRYWHTDVSYTEEPSMASFLFAIDVPPNGGDTLFAGTSAAYAALPADLRAQIDGLKGVHGLTKMTAPKMTDEQFAALKPEIHPLARTHPETGGKAIYAGAFAMGIQGLAEDEARKLLDRLADFCARERFVYRHRWRVGDFVVWDNRCVLHQATDFDPPYRRHLHRTTVAGGRPV